MDKTITIVDFLLETTFRVGIWIIFLWLDKQVPTIRHIDEDEMWHYRYPSVDSYVPKRYLYSVMFGIPIFIFILQFIINRKERNTVADIVNNAFGITLAYCINGIFTSFIKLGVGRPRPNFYLRCFPEGYGTDIDHCTGEYHGQMDGRKSFPSGHASFAFTGMVYMTLHLYKLLDMKKPRFCRGIIFFMMSLFILLATLIAVSRTADYHHHFSDVIGGAILGTTIAYVTQNLFKFDESGEEKYMEVLTMLSRAPSYN